MRNINNNNPFIYHHLKRMTITSNPGMDGNIQNPSQGFLYFKGVIDMEEYDNNMKRLKAIAQERKVVFNPDEARVQKVVGTMTENYIATGEYICPCKQKHKPPVKGLDTLCPCSGMMDEIAIDGHCHCRLFYTHETAEADQKGKASTDSSCCSQ